MINQQASVVLNALDEGIVFGIIETLKHQNHNISKEALYNEICNVLWDWTIERINYWCEWFNLISKRD